MLHSCRLPMPLPLENICNAFWLLPCFSLFRLQFFSLHNIVSTKKTCRPLGELSLSIVWLWRRWQNKKFHCQSLGWVVVSSCRSCRVVYRGLQGDFKIVFLYNLCGRYIKNAYSSYMHVPITWCISKNGLCQTGKWHRSSSISVFNLCVCIVGGKCTYIPLSA